MRYLKQSTSVDVGVGPFLDETDGKTAETALTITQPDIRLKKNGGAWAQKAAAQTLTHEENGWYEVTLDATDTDTIGILLVAVHESGALPVWMEFHVLAANVYDSLFGAATDKLDVNVEEWNTTAVPAEHTAGYPIVTIKDGTGTGEINTNAGAVALVDTVTTLTNLPAITSNWLTAAGLATDAVTEIRDAITGGAYALSTDANGRVRIVDGTAAGEIDTASGLVQITAAQIDQIVDETWDELSADHVGAGSIGERVERLDVIASGGSGGLTNARAVLLDNLDAAVSSRLIGTTTGSGFTAVPWNAAWDAEVQSEVDDALVAQRLDELLNADSDIDGAAPPTVGSVFHELMSKTTGSFTFVQTDDSLEAIRDRGDAAWITATGFSTLTQADVRTAVGLASANLDTQLAAIDDFLDTEVAAIKAKTDQLVFTTANRVDSQVFGVQANALTASAAATDFVQEIRDAITGGAYALNTDAGGNVKVSDGTGANQIELASGLVDLITPAEAAGRPTTLTAMLRRVFEQDHNKRTRERSTGVVLLRNAADSATLETQTQSTSGTLDSITQGA